MAKNALPVFTLDHRTGSMEEHRPDEMKDFTTADGEEDSALVRVLVADDSETDRRLTIRQLGKAWPIKRDMMVECAEDGDEALEKIRSNRYALVVLDWNMPQKDGATVLRAIREDGLSVPVVVVSGERRETIAGELDLMAAAFTSKNAMDTISFRIAIEASILLQGGRASEATGPDTMHV